MMKPSAANRPTNTGQPASMVAITWPAKLSIIPPHHAVTAYRVMWPPSSRSLKPLYPTPPPKKDPSSRT